MPIFEVETHNVLERIEAESVEDAVSKSSFATRVDPVRSVNGVPYVAPDAGANVGSLGAGAGGAAAASASAPEALPS